MARTSLSVAGAAAALAALALAPAAAAQTEVRQIAGGLASPRGLDVEGRHVYVAEAGSGGTRCLPGEGQPCVGRTGAVTRVGRNGSGQRRITRGLPSVLLPALGNEIIGPSDVSFRGGPGWLTVGLGANPALRDALGGPARELAWLYRYTRDGRARPFVDLGRSEVARDPDGQGPDSNPHGVEPLGGVRAVADAGANALLSVDRRARVRTLTVFPQVPAPGPGGATILADPVPTSVTRGRDGAYYVGQLVGFPFPEGAATVWRVPSGGGTPEPYAQGFTHITDLDFGPDGSLYVLQFASRSLLSGPSPGSVLRVRPDGSREEIAPGAVEAATGMDVAADGRIYVTSGGTSVDDGRVYEITPDR